MERWVEKALLASRWLMAPLYVGLALLLVLFVVDFFLKLAHIGAALAAGEDQNLTLAALTLLDLVLVASLIVMVMLSGFENFVGRITLSAEQERLSWLTSLGTGSIKVKIMGSIAVISGIYLLEKFFELDRIPTDRLLWLVIIHLTFVVTAVLLAVLDRLAEH